MKKKILCILLGIVLIAIGVVLGSIISDHTSSNPLDETTEETVYSEESIALEDLDILEAKPSLSLYRETVKKRLEEWDFSNKGFSRGDEWIYLKSRINGVSSYDTFIRDGDYAYYYPVLFNDNGNIVLWYTDESGTVITNWDEKHSSNYIGSLHFSGDDKGIERVYSTQEVAVTYIPHEGIIEKWEYGKVVNSTIISDYSVFCGISRFEGLIFRDGTDVYAIKEDGKPTVIAHDVKYVIDTEYRCGSDPWSQPLFLMTDGTLKVYINWEGDEDAPADDESHLVEPYHEGSYEKFR